MSRTTVPSPALTREQDDDDEDGEIRTTTIQLALPMARSFARRSRVREICTVEANAHRRNMVFVLLANRSQAVVDVVVVVDS